MNNLYFHGLTQVKQNYLFEFMNSFSCTSSKILYLDFKISNKKVQIKMFLLLNLTIFVITFVFYEVIYLILNEKNFSFIKM